LVEKIAELESRNRAGEAAGKARKSNLAYALTILDRVDELSHAKDLIKAQLDNSGEIWTNFADQVLRPRREIETTPLGGSKPPRLDGGMGGEFGSFSGGMSSGSGNYVDMSSDLNDEDDESGSNSDDSSGEEDDISSEENDDDEDLDIPDDADMDSERDSRDYDTDRVEVLLSKLDVEALLEISAQ
jgi:hypothetical protein